VFDGAGTIGRSPGNDWILPDPERFVSGQHAAISCEAGGYFLTDLSTNGTIVNGQVLPKGARVELQSGDRLTLGNYEIGVVIEAGAESGVLDHGVSLFGKGADRPLDSQPMAGRESSLDPLDFFGPAQNPVRGASPAAEPDHVPSHAEFFAPPPVRPDPVRAAERAESPLPPALKTPAPGGSHIPEDWDDIGLAAEAPPGERSRVEPDPRPAPPPAGDPFAAPQAPAQAQAHAHAQAQGHAQAHATSETASMPAAAAAAPGPDTASPLPRGDLEALLRGAGLDPATVDARMLASLGEILRVAVDGVLDVLQARAAIKSQFRVAMTTLKPVENNPLKFSASTEDALHNLFVRRSQSYLGPVDAFREAFDDLKAHQLALMAGMRAAFGTLLARFDPERLQEGFDKGLKRSALLDVINKTKYWDLYREMYAELGDDDATFRRLFGDEFAQAYEEQMQRLAAQARKRP
jgi:type VI secretion system FHA domain protein